MSASHGPPASRHVQPALVALLATRPELREVLPLARVLDEHARWCA